MQLTICDVHNKDVSMAFGLLSSVVEVSNFCRYRQRVDNSPQTLFIKTNIFHFEYWFVLKIVCNLTFSQLSPLDSTLVNPKYNSFSHRVIKSLNSMLAFIEYFCFL